MSSPEILHSGFPSEVSAACPSSRLRRLEPVQCSHTRSLNRYRLIGAETLPLVTVNSRVHASHRKNQFGSADPGMIAYGDPACPQLNKEKHKTDQANMQ